MNDQDNTYYPNNVTVVGRAGKDAELKYFDNGKAKAEVSIAVNRMPGSKDDVTDWFKIIFWDRTAEIAGEYVKKGSLIGVEGSLDA
ncbi:MAG TPA: single-stranded DNA-binding protein, partial [Vampirovibrionales bacterium]